MGVAIKVANPTIIKLPKIALASPPVLLGEGVISVNTAMLMPPIPLMTSTERIHASAAIPMAIAQSANTSETRLTITRRR